MEQSVLTEELKLIRDTAVREFTEHCLSQAPEYFWTKPSSSSGKYHPEQSNGEGGLVRHTQAVVYLAVKLCDVFSATRLETDCVIAACILHDILKYGPAPGEDHTTKDHDYRGALWVRELGIARGLDRRLLNIISEGIAWHMGRWTDMTGRTTPKEFPVEYGYIHLIVHLADVIAAQKRVCIT